MFTGSITKKLLLLLTTVGK